MSSAEPDPSSARGDDFFVTTRWTVVLSAGRNSSPESRLALSELCQNYWRPLYAYVRRRGRSKEDAEDLVQAFFMRLLEKDGLENLSPARGKFRAFLLASMKHFLANEWDKANRQKRGGGALHFSLDLQSADESCQIDLPDPTTPEVAFDRDWALVLLERVIARLGAECAATGKAPLFERAKGYLMIGETQIPYAQAAQELGMEEGAVRIAVHRFRKRYRELLRAEIAQTVADPAEVEEELRALQNSLGS